MSKNKVTVRSLKSDKQQKRRIAALTAYDASFARMLEDAGIDVILVGDSLGMVIHGNNSTVAVTMDDMVYHAKAVAKGCDRALLMVDMPFMSYGTVDSALANAARLVKEGGAEVLKLEGSQRQAEVIDALTANGIATCAHLGLTPQFVHKLGGYRVQGKDADAASRLINDAKVLEQAGADLLLLECVPATLAKDISGSVSVPVIGIGAGSECDGQILVSYDMLGITPGRVPRFAKNFMSDGRTLSQAVSAYVEEVKSGAFPSSEYIIAQ